MARLTHTVTVAPLDRGWFEEAAGTLVDLLDGSRARADGSVLLADGRAVAGLRLLKGRHLRAGARYGETPEPVTPGADGRVPAGSGTDGAADGPARPGTVGAADGLARPGTDGAGAAGGSSGPGASGGVPAPGPSATVGAVVLRAWRPAHSVEVESRVAEDGLALRLKVRLSEPRRPRALGLSLSGHRPDRGSLYRFSGRGAADLAAWWAAVDRLPSALPAARPPRHRAGGTPAGQGPPHGHPAPGRRRLLADLRRAERARAVAAAAGGRGGAVLRPPSRRAGLP
ncbi:hypothetical protein [Streptomyces sp. M54]|uniref:hypothetical protein n=1 Tax=Streptomyces sp. M54 TaxID=2759525 RepID=UPI0035300424